MAQFTKSTGSVVFTLCFLLAICTFVSATGRQVQCDNFVDDYSTLTIGGLKIPNPLTVVVEAIRLIKAVLNPGKTIDNETFAHPVDIIKNAGFSVECHKVTSEDGYITQLFRILPPENSDKNVPLFPSPRPKSPMDEQTDATETTRKSSTTQRTPTSTSSPTTNITTKYPIFLGHGLLSSSVDWLLAKSSVAIPFRLAREGYEVWLWNSRGNRYSLEHKSKNYSNSDYWDFGVHEMAVYDIPAAIDYMLEVTEADKINYIGYSMTTTAFHIMMSELPKYNKIIQKMVSLAPAVFLTNTKSPARVVSAVPNPVLVQVFQLLANGKVYPEQLNYVFHRILPEICDLELNVIDPVSVTSHFLCKNVVSLMAGHDAKANNRTTMMRQGAHMPTDTSARTLLLYLQYFNNPTFNQYDFGPLENVKRYNGSLTPPRYHLSKTKVDMLVIWGGQDDLVNKIDAEYYMSKLKSAKLTKCFANTYSHLSFVYADCQWQVVFTPILKFLQNEKYKCKTYKVE